MIIGRSVIASDPNLELDQLGVTIIIAKNLTFPEIVNDLNKEKLINLVENGPDGVLEQNHHKK